MDREGRCGVEFEKDDRKWGDCFLLKVTFLLTDLILSTPPRYGKKIHAITFSLSLSHWLDTDNGAATPQSSAGGR